MMSATEIAFRCLREGPKFAAYYKKSWQFGIRNVLSRDEWKHEDGRFFYPTDSDSVFPYEYLLFWEEESDDWKYMLDEPEVDLEIL
jgi:hypothetical protein